jgi:hypothetical protein
MYVFVLNTYQLHMATKSISERRTFRTYREPSTLLTAATSAPSGPRRLEVMRSAPSSSFLRPRCARMSSSTAAFADAHPEAAGAAAAPVSAVPKMSPAARDARSDPESSPALLADRTAGSTYAARRVRGSASASRWEGLARGAPPRPAPRRRRRRGPASDTLFKVFL